MKDTVTPPGRCPFGGNRVEGAFGDGKPASEWWPERLPVELLHNNSPEANPLGAEFDYAEAFSKIDLDALKEEIRTTLRTSQDWWPADYGHYGPQMVRMSWHSAGTYRISDGRGGNGGAYQRFFPIGSWIDNANVDKSRRLLWPIKQKYGKSLSWGDLIALTGNVSMEEMGLPMVGFGGGRIDVWEDDLGTYWGPEHEMLARGRWEGNPSTDGDDADLEAPVAASHMALIYVNPEGPAGNMDPMGSAREIRETFTRMAMNDEETVALIAGGHAFGKSHGAVSPDHMGPGPDGADIEHQGLGWINDAGTGNAEYTISNGIEGAWTSNPLQWDNDYFENLFRFEWEQTTSPAGSQQWTPKDPDARKTPDAHIEGKMNPLMMMTSDIALITDPEYRKISEKFLNDFDYFTEAFSKAWFKLLHRDMGPKDRYVGKDVPEQDFLWMDPTPKATGPQIDAAEAADLKSAILATGLSVSELVGAAWASASTFRRGDLRGGANGARLRLFPQTEWEVNKPDQLARVLSTLESVKAEFDGKGEKTVSMADLIVLAGAAGIEKAARDAGVEVTVPFTPGRTDATDEMTDHESFKWLEPVSDPFRNYVMDVKAKSESLMLDKADQLGLTAPELTVLLGGMRVLGTNWDDSEHGVFTDRPGVLSNDFFVNLLDMGTKWTPVSEARTHFEGSDRKTGQKRYTATRVDLVFGHNTQLRSVCEVYASDDGHAKMVEDFVAAWDKVMMSGRFDVKKNSYNV
ncbi:catalase/peroxidase HPI [Salipiger sp. IMCC34102]|uniref:catalase/peroxidase HPI n=1 Tax=Salipiger sp. IMCC34102 TaxID=2510647 RepID=UPI00101C4FD8|nr:catalase/peroxidase HPI [Salipiger sp. IMCC34102]RYH03043.1 catalase/peroxidase HPI [Salipiger sp. IMCC34102]